MKTFWLALFLSMLALPASAYYPQFAERYYNPHYSGYYNPYRSYESYPRYTPRAHHSRPQLRNYDWSWGGGNRGYLGGRGGGWGGEW